MAKGFGQFGSDRHLKNLEDKTLGQRTKDISGEPTFGIERSYRKRLAKDMKHRALRSRMMAPVDAPNSKGFDVKR